MARQVAKRDEGMFDDAATTWSNQRTQPLEVICLGLCRTGTTSMLEALSVLGYGTSYNSREMLRRGHARFCAEGLRRKHEGGKQFDLEQFESLWGNYRTISGEPAYIFAEECIKLYPDAKVILTVRDDEEKWHRSLMETMWQNHESSVAAFLAYVDKVYATMAGFTNVYWKHLFFNDVPNHGIRVYREHNARVQRLAAGRLLVFNTKQGWGPLCDFLGKDAPSQKFPHVNNRVEYLHLFTQARRQALKAFVRKMLLRGVLPLMLLVLIWWRRVNIVDALKRLGRLN